MDILMVLEKENFSKEQLHANSMRDHSQGAEVYRHQKTSIHNVASYEPQQIFRLPPIETFDVGYEEPKPDSWNGNSDPRVRFEDVLLSPKNSVQHASRPPTLSARGHPHVPSSSLRSPPSHSHSLPLRSPRQSRGSIGVKRAPRLSQSQENQEVDRLSPPSSDDVYTAEGEYDESSTKTRKLTGKQYSQAQADWIRYYQEDMGLTYKKMVKKFVETWPGESRTERSISTQAYRDDYIPCVDADGRVARDDKGRPIMEREKRKIAVGKDRYMPYTLVERYPWRAVDYSWVSEDSKELARKIMDGDKKDPTSAEAEWRQRFYSIDEWQFHHFREQMPHMLGVVRRDAQKIGLRKHKKRRTSRG